MVRIRFQVQSFRFQVSGFKFQVSGFRFRVSGFGFRVSGFRLKNRWEDEVKFLELTQGRHAKVDDEDWEYLGQWQWHASRKGKRGQYYGCRTRRKGESGSRCRLLHYEVLRLVQPLGGGKVIDHINRDPLDCRKGNLRICTHRENLRNQRPQLRGTSQYRGVYFQRKKGKWTAKIKYEGKAKYLGLFKTEYQAMLIYNGAAMRYFGLFAYLNQWRGPTRCPASYEPRWEENEPGVTRVRSWALRNGYRIYESPADSQSGSFNYVI